MSHYVMPIQMGFLFFPVIALLFTFPYMLVQYRKFGSIPAFRTIVVYSLILYLLCAYFLVILPLPSIEEVASYTSPTMQLVPFQFVADMIQESKFVWTQPNTYIELIANPAIYQVLYNIVMVLPFGIYLRYYFKKNWLETVGYSFLLSLFFELTQLSGLYGIYPRGYRLFDVDDLMINTFGGALGYFVTPLISWVLPSKERLDEISYEKGKQVSYTRRWIAFGIDMIFVSMLSILIRIFLPLNSLGNFVGQFGLSSNYVCAVIVYFMILLPLWKGKTIGKRVVKLQVVSQNDGSVKWYQYVIRYGLLYFILIPAPLIVICLLDILLGKSSILQLLLLGVMFLLMIVYAVSLFQMFLSIFTSKKQLFYEKWSRTMNKSTVEFKVNEKDDKTESEENEVGEERK